MRVALVCQLIIESVKGIKPHRHVLSVDEKTSIQALSRHEQRAPRSKGLQKRKEFEYERNGTTCLIGAFDVAVGKLVHKKIQPTRTEEDFCDFTEELIQLYPPKDEIVIMADQLNIHMSESLVRLVAGIIGFEDDLGKKRTSGILYDMESRKAFLEQPNHRIRFIFTPKHCSWLNPIENWFAKLQKHVIKNGNFSSVKELEDKIVQYIQYYNNCLVKPLNWKFKGFNKDKPILHKKVS